MFYTRVLIDFSQHLYEIMKKKMISSFVTYMVETSFLCQNVAVAYWKLLLIESCSLLKAVAYQINWACLQWKKNEKRTVNVGKIRFWKKLIVYLSTFLDTFVPKESLGNA